MGNPDDIPQDVWDAAWGCWGKVDGVGIIHTPQRKVLALSIARAIMAERERCAADLEIIAGKLVQRANDAFNGRDQGSAIILKSQADALTESAAAIRGGQS